MAQDTYHGTLFHPDLREATVVLYTTEKPKHEGRHVDEESKMELTGLTSWTLVVGGEEADAVEEITGLKDENREYLILRFEDFTTRIYRNSHVIMFIH